MENAKIISINSGIVIEEDEAKRLKTKRTDFDKFKLFGQNVIVEEQKIEEETPSYVEDNSYEEETPAIAEEPSKISGMLGDFNLNEITKPKIVEESPVVEEPKNEFVAPQPAQAWGNHEYKPQSIPSIASATMTQQKQVATATAAAGTTTASVIDKINTAPKEEVKNADYYINLRNNKDKKLGPTANKVLDSETPELDKLIKLLEKLHSQLEDLKAKKEELKQRKQDVLEGKASIDELLGKTMTLDLTAIQSRAKALNGANDVIDKLRKSVEEIKGVGIESENTVKIIESDIKNVEENIVKTEEEISNVEVEKNNKCVKLGEDLKTATSIDEKEELVKKQLEILIKQKEALTGTLPKVNPFEAMRVEEETSKARAA